MQHELNNHRHDIILKHYYVNINISHTERCRLPP